PLHQASSGTLAGELFVYRGRPLARLCMPASSLLVHAPQSRIRERDGELAGVRIAADIARLHLEQVVAVRVPAGVERALEPEVEEARRAWVVLRRVRRVDDSEVDVGWRVAPDVGPDRVTVVDC